MTLIVATVPPQTATDYRLQGLALRNQQQFPQAIAALEKSVELAPQDPQGRVILGWTYHLAGQSMAARRSLWQAIYLDPLAVPAFNALGIVYLVNGDLLPSITIHSWAAFLKPNNKIAYYNLSLAYQALGLWYPAANYADIAIRLEPTNPHPLIAKAIALWSGGDRPSAQNLLAQAISLNQRYGDREFLSNLSAAGFSSSQIRLTQQILDR